MKEKFEIYGEIASLGYGEGEAILIFPYEHYLSKEKLIQKEQKINEYNKFQYYIKKTINKIKKIQKEFPDSIKDLLEIQIYFLKDPIFQEAVKENIFIQGKSLTLSIYDGSLELKRFFEEQANDFMKQRWIDFQDAVFQLLDEITGISYFEICINKIKEKIKNNKDYILVAEDISPLLYLKLPKPNGILLKEGNLSGHLTLLAANQGIPILIHAFPKENFYQIKEGQWISIDTNKGKAIIYSQNYSLKLDKQEKPYTQRKKDYKISSLNVIISLNADDLEIIKQHKNHYKLSVGLYRTEFIYLKNPSLIFNIKDSANIYDSLYKEMEENEILTLRLIDVDEDKATYFFYTSPENRGKRGIDYYRAEIKIIQNQIKSIFLPLKNYQELNWTLRILIPMIATYDDWIFIKDLIYEELHTLNQSIKNQIQMGIMLEVPSILYSIPILDEEVNFYSIGTNDLLANFLGKKRNQISQDDYYEPSFYRMLYLSLKETKKEISICGNLATHLDFIKIFYFFGVRNFSVPFGYYSKIYDYFCNSKNNHLFESNLIPQLLLTKKKEDFKNKLKLII